MTPLQKVAMGLVIVLVSARFGGWDALPDPVGWGLVLAGLVPIRDRLPSGDVALWLAAVATLVSLPLVLPSLSAQLTPSGQWAVSLPQSGFCLVLAIGLGAATGRVEDRRARAFRVLRTLFLVVMVGPVLVYGGGLDELLTPVAVVSVLAGAGLVWCTFSVSRRLYASSADSTPGARE